MFRSARIKLTFWYTLIIMLISIFFSVAIYEVLTSELDRVERMQRLRIERQLPQFYDLFPIPKLQPKHLFIDPELVVETKNRLLLILALINFSILAISAGAGYLLAGKTLRPIANMVKDQNRFISDASHELRTPLTSLKTEIEVNLRDKNLKPDQLKKILLSNLEEVNHLQYLSDNLIKFTQYQKNTDLNISKNLSLLSIFDESIKMIAKLAKYKNIVIKNNITNLKIDGNKDSLVELFVIFLDNAIKYSPDKTAITLTSKKTAQQISVSIADQGIGIEESDILNIFDRFYRVNKSRNKDRVTGYGLGLSIAKQIVEKYNGNISVKSKINSGTTFTINFPAEQPV